jgi:hypothetical protein
LFFDIETSPNVGLFWQAGYKLNITYESIIKERAIICICYKWEGEEKIYSLEWDENQNDKKLLEDFIKITNEADEIIAHNVDRFDLPWLRTRCLYHDIPMFPQYTTIDTLKQARSKFKFNSNQLDYISQYLGLGKKKSSGYDLWKNILLLNDKISLEKMIDYCKHDVDLLEKVYNKLSFHFPSKTHFGVLDGNEKYSCPSCGCEESKYVKTRMSATGTPRIQLQCTKCNKHHTVSSKVYENFINNVSTLKQVDIKV